MDVCFKAIAFVKNSRQDASDDFWNETSEIVLAEHIPTVAFENISQFSHLEIIYYFDKVSAADSVFSGHPRGNKAYPRMGIFAQRKKDRPNAIGLCTVQLIKHQGRSIIVKYLDAINGTPVLDIKPVFKEFQAQGEIKQAAWVSDLMKNYWS